MKKQSNPQKHTLLGLALAILSAVFLTLAFPPYNQGFLIWVGLIPMLVAQYRLLPARLSSLAPAIAIGGWLGVLLVPMFGGKSFFMAAIPFMVGVISLVMDKNKRLFHERTAYRWFVMEGVLGWVGLEMIRSFIPALGTWFFVGYPLWNQPWLLQPLSLFGIYGLDLLIMLANYALALFLFGLIDKRWKVDGSPFIDSRPARNWFFTFLILLTAWIGLSLSLYSTSTANVPTVRVAAVQPNLPRAAHRDTSTTPEHRLAILSAQTREAGAQGAQIIVLPEMGLGFDPQNQHTQELQSLAISMQAYLVIGYVVDDESGFRNEATVLAPTGEFLGVYGKMHPAVFSGEPKTITNGTYPVYDTTVGKLATMICFDAHFTDVTRQFGGQGAQIVAIPSLFGSSIAQSLHVFLPFRAIEDRAAIIMTDVAFNSAIVDPYGHVLKLSITAEGSSTTLIADVPLGSGNTLYSKLGDWLGWLSLAGLVFFAIFMPITLRKENMK